MFVGQFEFVLCVLALRMLVVRVRDSGLRFGGLYEYRVLVSGQCSSRDLRLLIRVDDLIDPHSIPPARAHLPSGKRGLGGGSAVPSQS